MALWDLMGILGTGLATTAKKATTAPQGTSNSVVPSDPTALTSSVTTPVTTNNVGSNSIRNWAASQGFGGVSYDPNTGGINIAGKAFQSGNIPGTTFDSGSNTHYVTDPDTLTKSLGYLKTPMSLQQLVLDALSASTASSSDMIKAAEAGAGAAPVIGEVAPYDYWENIASKQLAYSYQKSLKDVLGALATDQQGRGFYGQLPADVITQGAIADLEAAHNSDIANLAQNLLAQAENRETQRYQSAVGLYQQKLSNAMEAIAQSNAAGRERLANLISFADFLSGNAQADREYQLDIDKLGLTKDQASFEKALSATQTFGGVLSPEMAAILGVPEGTMTADYLLGQASLANRGGRGGSSTADTDDDGDIALMGIESAFATGALTQNQAADQVNVLLNYGKTTPQKAYSAYSRIMGITPGASTTPQSKPYVNRAWEGIISQETADWMNYLTGKSPMPKLKGVIPGIA